LSATTRVHKALEFITSIDRGGKFSKAFATNNGLFGSISIYNPVFDACFISRELGRAVFLAGHQPDKTAEEENGEDSEFHDDDDDNEEIERADKLWLKIKGSLFVLEAIIISGCLLR
jgi:hypothetical protein